MQIPLRIQCPNCNWGYEFKNKLINMGWIKLKCNHCDGEFFTKITINDFKIETQEEIPEAPILDFNQ